MSRPDIHERMKDYEYVNRTYLTKRLPTIIRIDGDNFKKFTEDFKKPFDMVFMEAMWRTAKFLCENIGDCKLAFIQSDEINLLLTDYDEPNTESWVNKNLTKMISMSVSMATMAFNKFFAEIINEMSFDKSNGFLEAYLEKRFTATFKSAVFNLPKDEVCNYFYWRQFEGSKNAVRMVGQTNFTHDQLHGISCDEVKEMLYTQKHVNFDSLPVYQKQGACAIKERYKKDGAKRSRWIIDKNIPLFHEDREYIEKLIKPLL